jgi:hypothetical protein
MLQINVQAWILIISIYYIMYKHLYDEAYFLSEVRFDLISLYEGSAKKT